MNLVKIGIQTLVCTHTNNLGLAFKNSIVANKNGVKWIDSTITGMGRGPGNLKTEEILKIFNKR